MESLAMKKDQLEQIGLYVKKNLPKWLGESSKAFRSEIDLRERTVRVEEELRSQRELMKQGFDEMGKRFEFFERSIDKRFEQVDKRLTLMTWAMGLGFTAVLGFISIAIAIIKN